MSANGQNIRLTEQSDVKLDNFFIQVLGVCFLLVGILIWLIENIHIYIYIYENTYIKLKSIISFEIQFKTYIYIYIYIINSLINTSY